MAKQGFTPIKLDPNEAMQKASEEKVETANVVTEEPQDKGPQESTVPLSMVQELVKQQVAEALKSQVPVVETPKPINYQAKVDSIDEIPGLENFEYKDRIYIAIDGEKAPSVGIRSKHKKLSPLQWTNPVTKVVHSLRFSSNQPSIFADKQTGDVLTEHIIMKKGVLRVSKDQTTLQKFLAIHPDNGTRFKELDEAMESKKVVDQEEILFEAQKLSREIDSIQLDAAARLICAGYSEQWDPYTLKKEVFAEVKRNPERFIQIASDPSLKVKGVIKTALGRGYIAYRNYKYYDGNNQLILEVGRNDNEIDAMSQYMGTNEGRRLYEYLLQAIS